MKFLIEDKQFTYSVDWSKYNKEEGGFIEEYFPEVNEAISDFIQLLYNLYPKEKIADCLASGTLPALDYSERGIKARDLLKGM